MSRSGTMNRRGCFVIFKPVVLVDNVDNNRRTRRGTMSDSSEELALVGFDCLTASPTISTLSPFEFLIDEVDVEG